MHYHKLFAAAAIVASCLLPTLSQAARWWNPDDNSDDGSGMDLDSFKTYTDSEGYEVTSMWIRGMGDEAKRIYNPKLRKESITSAFSMLIQVRCDTGELKLADFIFQDRKYTTLWRLSQYPEYAEYMPYTFNEFFTPEPSSNEAQVSASVCALKDMIAQEGLTDLAEIELDGHGHMIE